ncbi:helix-turn-helix domain-containing protein [Cohnella rhizosphaerae]|uniref:Helix-turn-helix domain-containing protein n=1 Tax=Cohnella rhizosphaerae TaxID=1457232 RepID=A0A9X4QT90_9BACL|nr:helix-turn-helix domain-containing protein [Cohnella rhizosphaerae]MDG0810073.1 helix-turn-helix domain-containing protein [Cohnella rhizosphaerae]
MREVEVTGTAHLQLKINIPADYVIIKKEELEELRRIAAEARSAASEEKDEIPPTLTMEQVARYLGIGRTRVFHLIKSGELSSYKIGKSRRVRRTDLLEFEKRLRKGVMQ